MSDNLLRDTIIVEARNWMEAQGKYYSESYVLAEAMADFVLHMTGADAPTLRYVSDAVDMGKCLCYYAIKDFDGVNHDKRCREVDHDTR